MVAKLILPTDTINIQQLCCLIYGQPGSRKSSLAQTADNPITLAFDPGVYRAYGRKTAVLFDTWADVLSFDLKPYGTIVVDTVGMALEKLALAVISDNPKNGNRLGGLTLPGYGVLKTQFANWVSSIKNNGQSLLFTAHEKGEKSGDETYYFPDIVGSNYNTLMNICDMVGYMHFDGGKRAIDFAPTDRWMAKTPPCGWGRIDLPDFSKEPHFFAGLLNEAKASMGKISEESAAIAAQVAEWGKMLEDDPTLAEFNGMLPTMGKLPDSTKKQVWHLMQGHAKKVGWNFDKTSKAFVGQPEEAAV